MADFVVNSTPAIAIVILAAGLIGYALALALAAFGNATSTTSDLAVLGKWIADWIEQNPYCNLGIPCSALASYAIVSALLEAFPPPTEKNGDLIIKAFSLEFSGPSGPVTLWLICFLGFVFAMKLLGK
ncbi:MAG: hypothetical protein KDA70_13165 [Planctomycetaceae bacterium]|nr:hypothetical protein [Planctomycetaceae bacterium]